MDAGDDIERSEQLLLVLGRVQAPRRFGWQPRAAAAAEQRHRDARDAHVVHVVEHRAPVAAAVVVVGAGGVGVGVGVGALAVARARRRAGQRVAN